MCFKCSHIFNNQATIHMHLEGGRGIIRNLRGLRIFLGVSSSRYQPSLGELHYKPVCQLKFGIQAFVLQFT